PEQSVSLDAGPEGPAIAKSRTAAPRASGPDGDLHDAVALVREEVVGGLDLGKGEGVCHELTEREALRGDDAHEPPHALLAARAECRDDRVFAEARREWLERHGEVP